MTLPYRHEIDGCRAETIGAAGLSDDRLDAWLAAAGRALDGLRRQRGEGTAPAFLDLPQARGDLQPAATLAARFRGAFERVLVLGTGGSSLGGQALAALADRGFGPPAGAPAVHFLDNVDPDTFDALLRTIDPATTGVLAISKSGGTAETLCQLAIVLDLFRRARGEAALKKHVAVMTEARDSPLGALAERYGLIRLDHDPHLGGRFSVLSTGIVPAMLLGLDAAALRAGAAEATEATLGAESAAAAAPAAGAALQVAMAEERGISQSVLMPYCDRLFWFSRWYRQLWAESLGKRGRGTTPVDALGTVDQHSQLQLYLDGPADKLFTLIEVAAAGQGDRVAPDIAGRPELDYLAGRTIGDLMAAEARATGASLRAHGRPVRTIALARLDAHTLGALFQHFMLETALAAALWQVDAYDQPAVEDGKRRTKAALRGEPTE
jgi:glucose-6-phosphate isomerase